MKPIYESLVVPVRFGWVRRTLRCAKSPACGALFVATRQLLLEVAALLDGPDVRTLGFRQRRLLALFESGQVQRGLISVQTGGGVDMEAIAEGESCHVISMCSLHLVHAPGLEAQWWSQRQTAL